MPDTRTDRIDGLTTSVSLKAPCRVVSTSPVTFVGDAPYGFQTIDGVTVSDNLSVPGMPPPDRVLLVGQSDQTQNGIWQVSSLAWSRALDFDGARDAVKGTFVYVNEGTTYANSTWKVTTANPVVFGTSNITFALVFAPITSLAGGNIYWFSTTTAMLAAIAGPVVLVDGQIVQTTGETAEGDGGGTQFYYNASDTTSSDNGSTIRVDSAGRRWYALQQFNYDSIKHVGDGSGNTGDLGAQINAAYAALPASGGKIVINPKVGGGKYDFSTPIVFNILGKYVLLAGLAPGGASAAEGCCLNYTPVTATAAITMDYASIVISPPAPNHGLRDITLTNNGIVASGGGGSLATGILVGVTNGGDWDATYDRVMVQGFGVGYSNLNNTAVTQQWNNPIFIANDTALTIGGATERFIGGQFAANGRVFNQPAGTHQAELYFIGTNFFDNFHDPVFDCNNSTTKVYLNFSDCHMENSPSLHAHYIGGAANVTMHGGLLEDDNSTGTNAWMIQVSNFCVVFIMGTSVAVARAQTCIVDCANEIRSIISLMILSPSLVTASVAGSFASEQTVITLTPFGTTPEGINLRGAVTLQDIPKFAGTNTTGAGSATLGSNCPAVTPTGVYKWIQVTLADGSTAYVPAWK